MVTTLMDNSTRERFVARVSTSPDSFMTSVSTSPVAPSVQAAAHHPCAPTTTAMTVIAYDATNRWLGGIDGLGCGSDQGTTGTKRIHPGRLGGVT